MVIETMKQYIQKSIRAINKFRFLQMRRSTRDVFSIVEPEIHTACNRRCPYCPNATYDRGLIQNQQFMDTAVYHKIIDDLYECGFVGMLRPHLYNEPLMDERIFDFISYAKNKLGKDLFFEIATNGDYLDVGMYRKLVTAGVDKLLITIHPPVEPKHIDEVLAYREKNGDDGVAVEVQRLKAWMNRGGLVDLKDSIRMESCDVATKFLIIDHRGNVMLCMSDYFITHTFGNVAQENLMKIWWKPYYKKIRQDLRDGNMPYEICKKCEFTEESEETNS